MKNCTVRPVSNGYIIDFFSTDYKEEQTGMGKTFIAKDEPEVVSIMKREFKEGGKR